MAMNGTQGYRPGLVDLTTGQISREIFVNDDIYAEEQERVFARSWLFVGHESQIPNPGYPDGTTEKQPLNFPNLNLAFTFAVQDLKSLWRWYRYGYEKELTK